MRSKKEDIIAQLHTHRRNYEDFRYEREQKWLEAWGQYFSTPEAQHFLRSRAFHTVGDVNVDWRHRIPTGKAFEMVESVTSFMMGAFFPNNNWFDVEPQEPLGLDPEQYRKYLRTVRRFTDRKLEQGNFQDYWENFTRQAVTIGTSALALPWRYEKETKPQNVRVQQPDGTYKVEKQQVDRTKKNGFDFEVISMFDLYLDPRSQQANEGNVLRRYERTRSEVKRQVELGAFPETTVKAIEDLQAKNSPTGLPEANKQEQLNFEGFQEQAHNPEDVLELYEYWGDIEIEGESHRNVVITICGDELLQFEKNPFWSGKPFIIGTFISSVASPYGLGVLDSVLGDLHAKMLTRNQRLDIVEMTLNPMFEAVNDGTIDFTNLYSEAGKVIPVAEQGNIRQLNTIADVGTSVQEEQLMEQSIEKTTGTGAFIGSGATRNAERVTAQEIEATRSAGGNRLNGVHRHMERTALLPALEKAFGTIQQFMTEDELVPVPMLEDPESVEFVEVGIDELNQELLLKPIGADFLADKEFELRQRLDFISTAGNIEPMSKQLNWSEITKDLARRFLRDDWEKYIKDPEEAEGAAQELTQGQQQQPTPEEQAAQAQLSQEQQLSQGAQEFGGEPAQLALQKQQQTGQTQETLGQLSEALRANRG